VLALVSGRLFTEMKRKVEHLYSAAGGRGVVLLAHSMGCKVSAPPLACSPGGRCCSSLLGGHPHARLACGCRLSTLEKMLAAGGGGRRLVACQYPQVVYYFLRWVLWHELRAQLVGFLTSAPRSQQAGVGSDGGEEELEPGIDPAIPRVSECVVFVVAAAAAPVVVVVADFVAPFGSLLFFSRRAKAARLGVRAGARAPSTLLSSRVTRLRWFPIGSPLPSPCRFTWRTPCSCLGR
jgi:hypothetical protein